MIRKCLTICAERLQRNDGAGNDDAPGAGIPRVPDGQERQVCVRTTVPIARTFHETAGQRILSSFRFSASTVRCISTWAAAFASCSCCTPGMLELLLSSSLCALASLAITLDSFVPFLVILDRALLTLFRSLGSWLMFHFLGCRGRPPSAGPHACSAARPFPVCSSPAGSAFWPISSGLVVALGRTRVLAIGLAQLLGPLVHLLLHDCLVQAYADVSHRRLQRWILHRVVVPPWRKARETVLLPCSLFRVTLASMSTGALEAGGK